MRIEQIKSNFTHAQDVLKEFMSDPGTWENLDKAGQMLAKTLKNGGKIMSCGNGGSLCDAMHFAEELTGRFQKDRRPLAAMSINDPSHITCVVNDYGMDFIFSRTVEALGKPGDVLLAISTSGNSQNVINVVRSSKQCRMKVIALTGKSGGEMATLSDVEIRAPYSENSDRVQEIHIKVIHSLVNYIELSLSLG